MIYKPYAYQQTALDWVMDHERCALFLDMGLGKTVITLTAIQRLVDDAEVGKALIVAPKKVAESTWTSEADKWNHLSLEVSKVMGTEKQRIAALQAEADVYVIGRDSFVWLVGYYNGRLPFDMLVIDELTSFKTPKSKRFRAMRIVTPLFRRVVGLTGTPAPNGLIDLWAQMYCIDMGARLGTRVTRYRDTYFDAFRYNGIVVRCTPKKGAEEVIRKKITDICLSMQAKDYLTLPDLLIHDEKVLLSPATMEAYNKFERDRVMEFQEEHTGEKANVLATSAAALMNKLSQYSNGAVYDADHNVYDVHDEKLARLAELVEAAGSPVLVFYQFKHDIPRIQSKLGKGYKVVVYEDDSTLRSWNRGEIDVLLAHPASTAFGLNMQAGGHYIVWFGTGWNLELYQQANARLHRQGQQHPVTVYNLMCAGTVDEMAVKALHSKKSVQQGLLDGLDALTRRHPHGARRPPAP